MDKNYDLPECQASDEDLWRIFHSAKIIAIVGLSRSKNADSYRVASYLQEHGFRIIPVRPKAESILGEQCYAALEDVPGKIDIGNVFRRPEEVSGIVDSAISVGAKVIWTQEQIVDCVAAAKAHEAGLHVVMDKCIMKEHKRYKIDMSL